MVYGGTQAGGGVIVDNGSTVIYEFYHPLMGGDPVYDIAAAIDDEISLSVEGKISWAGYSVFDGFARFRLDAGRSFSSADYTVDCRPLDLSDIRGRRIPFLGGVKSQHGPWGLLQRLGWR